MLVGTWDDVYITVHVVCPVCRSSSESSNGCQCGLEDGESKLASDVRNGVTIGCAPFFNSLLCRVSASFPMPPLVKNTSGVKELFSTWIILSLYTTKGLLLKFCED